MNHKLNCITLTPRRQAIQFEPHSMKYPAVGLSQHRTKPF